MPMALIMQELVHLMTDCQKVNVLNVAVLNGISYLLKPPQSVKVASHILNALNVAIQHICNTFGDLTYNNVQTPNNPKQWHIYHLQKKKDLKFIS